MLFTLTTLNSLAQERKGSLGSILRSAASRQFIAKDWLMIQKSSMISSKLENYISSLNEQDANLQYAASRKITIFTSTYDEF